jgi:hypothetical protein
MSVESDVQDNNPAEEGTDPNPMDSADPRSLRGRLNGLVSTEADDNASEDYDSGESEDDDQLDHCVSGHSESDDDGEVATLRCNVSDGLHYVMEEQWEELESDGEWRTCKREATVVASIQLRRSLLYQSATIRDAKLAFGDAK